MSVHPLLVGAVLSGFAAPAGARDRAFRAEAPPAYAAAAPRPVQSHLPQSPAPGTGFSGAFGVRQTIRNLGY